MSSARDSAVKTDIRVGAIERCASDHVSSGEIGWSSFKVGRETMLVVEEGLVRWRARRFTDQSETRLSDYQQQTGCMGVNKVGSGLSGTRGLGWGGNPRQDVASLFA